MKKIFFISLILLLIVGCADPIVEKRLKNQNLTTQEMENYLKDKDNYDKKIQERKAEIEAGKYRPPTPEQVRLGKREYSGSGCGNVDVDISPETCRQFGFLTGSRVRTPDGDAYFVGVDKESDPWFHVDGEIGGRFYRDYSKDDFIKKGFVLLRPETAENAQSVSNPDPSPVSSCEAQSSSVPKTAKKSAQNTAENSQKEDGSCMVVKIERLKHIPPIPSLVEE